MLNKPGSIYLVIPYAYDSIVAIRARALMRTLQKDLKIVYFFKQKGFRRWLKIWNDIRTIRPKAIYSFKADKHCIYASFFGKFFGAKTLVDVGDDRYGLAKARGRGVLGCCIAKKAEDIAFKLSNGITVKGTFHKKFLNERGYGNVWVVPDGVDLSHSQYIEDRELRRKLTGAGEWITVGVLGSTNWNRKKKMCYGWELIEVLKELRDLPVFGIMVGDGSGLPRLKEMTREYDLESRIAFVGRIPYSEVPKYVSLMDIAISTQTNDILGKVRTTGKLPEYLGCGRYILASRVGEAELVLPEEMLVDYYGSGRDDGYPRRLAERIRYLAGNRELLRKGEVGPQIVKERFEYSILSTKVYQIVRDLL